MRRVGKGVIYASAIQVCRMQVDGKEGKARQRRSYRRKWYQIVSKCVTGHVDDEYEECAAMFKVRGNTGTGIEAVEI